jgi:subtilisin family serine protease
VASIQERKTVRFRQRDSWRKPRVFWLAAVAAFTALPVVSDTLAAIRIEREQPQQLGVYRRPASGDLGTIREVAEQGAAQSVKFKAGVRIAHFITKKCGLPATTIEIHPEYESIFLQRNKKSELTHQDMFGLSKDAEVVMPACVAFSTFVGKVVVPEQGVAKLAEARSIPFESAIFADAIGRSELHAKLSAAVTRAVQDLAFDEFRLLSDQLCKQASPVSLLACLNALTIAGANPEMANAKSSGGTISVPIAGVKAPAVVELDRVLLNDDAIAAAIEDTGFCSFFVVKNLCGFGSTIKGQMASVFKNGFTFNKTSELNDIEYHTGQDPGTGEQRLQKPTLQIRRESGLKFVTEVEAPEAYPSCAEAEQLNPGKWPFDVAEFERAARLSDIEHNPEKGKILVADTGFDFAGDEADDPAILAQTRDIFLRKYFHILEPRQDPDLRADRNEDGVPGNGGWAGVNVAGTYSGERSSRSVVNYRYQEHGLSVTTLALGGRQLDALRALDKLKIAIGEVNLVPRYNDPYLTTAFVSNTVKFAIARGNEFDVINLSLSSEVNDPAWSGLVDTAKHMTFVVAAGNDAQELTAEKGVWPAALGGAVATNDPSLTSFITVGAHDGKGGYVEFSNHGAGVDVFAPGCAVPSYALKRDDDGNVTGIAEKSITGTSAAAPLVSFAAGLLAGSFEFNKQPAAIKTRIQVGTDYNPSLQSRAVSSGVLNIAKVIGFKYDIIELADKNQPVSGGKSAGKLVHGAATLASDNGRFKCDFGPAIPLNTIKKIARGKAANDPVLVLATDDPTKRYKLASHFCPPDALSRLTIQFTDAETQASAPINMEDFRDYIAKR